MSLSTHVLDAALGRPAAGVAVRLEKDGQVLAEGVTDADGRIGGWTCRAGAHRIVFDTGAYFAARAVDAFYPRGLDRLHGREPGRAPPRAAAAAARSPTRPTEGAS